MTCCGFFMPRKPKPLTAIEKIDLLWFDLAGWPLWDKGIKALENYIELIGFEEVEEAVVASAERPVSRLDRWRYCCGICRNKLAERMVGGELPKQR